MEKSKTVTEITKALLAAQKEIGTLFKNKLVKAGKFDYKYADLAAVIDLIKEPLNKHDIVFLQSIDAKDGGDAILETILMHTSGEFYSSKTPIYCASPNSPQAFGSGVSYAKRYALLALLGLPTEDDDGDKASKEPKKKPVQIPEPNEAEQLLINEIYDGLCQGEVPGGMEIDEEKLTRAIYSVKSDYPQNKEVVGKIIAYFTKNIGDVCRPSTASKPEVDDPYWCNDCELPCMPTQEGCCSECGSSDIVPFSQHRKEAHESIADLRKEKPNV